MELVEFVRLLPAVRGWSFEIWWRGMLWWRGMMTAGRRVRGNVCSECGILSGGGKLAMSVCSC